MESVKIMKEADIDKLSATLSFDQFSRQKMVAYLINESFRKSLNGKKIKIIDVGGHGGKTDEFQPKDKVTILDVFNEKYDNYIKGDANKTGFKDNEFDIACSFDVLEHIDRKQRSNFISESLRISKFGIFLAVPIDVENKVSNAEVLLNDFYKNICGVDHKWLKEHIDNKIPTSEEIDKLVLKNKAFQTSISSNQIGDWQIMQMLIFASSKNSDIVGAVSNINTWYNKNISILDSNVDIGYRKIYFISKSSRNIDRVARAINKLKMTTKQNKLITINEATFKKFSNALSIICSKYMSLIDKYESINNPNDELIQRINSLETQLKASQNNSELLEKEILNIHSSFFWKVMKPIRAIKRIIKNE